MIVDYTDRFPGYFGVKEMGTLENPPPPPLLIPCMIIVYLMYSSFHRKKVAGEYTTEMMLPSSD